MPKPLLSLQNVNKFYGDLHVLKDLSIDIFQGEFLTLLGPSGCGKTTILRCIAGFENINSGDIKLNDKSMVTLPPNKRSVNTVFQNYALFPHLTVYENIAYGPKIKKEIPKDTIKQKVDEVLELVQMQGYEQRKPDQLSGGQMQRIAIARALINNPDILLLDEPLGALDLKLRKHMQYELSNIQKKTGTTFVYVTHDQDEALNISDRIAVMDNGIIEQLGTPREVYNYPQNLFVADFVGERNIFTVKVLEKLSESSVKISLGGTSVVAKCYKKECDHAHFGNKINLAVHADKMRISCQPVDNSFKAVVTSVHYAGSQIRTEVKVDEHSLRVIEYFAGDCDYDIGDAVYVWWQEDAAVLLPCDDENDQNVSQEGDVS